VIARREPGTFTLARLRPRRSDELLTQLDDAARQTTETLETLDRVVHSHPHSDELVGTVRELDETVHRTTRDVVRQLHERFVVPAEPEDLRALAMTLAGLTTGAAQIATRLGIFRLPAPREHARRLSHLLMEAGVVVRDIVAGLADGHSPVGQGQQLRDRAREGHELVRDGLADLFADAPEAAVLVAWSDLYEHFTAMLGSLSTIADTLDAIKPPRR
jgi:uncharacterized protein Yka (UPF0111/DUF47 family)